MTDLDLAFFFSVQIRECPPTPIPRENDDYSTFCHWEPSRSNHGFYLFSYIFAFLLCASCLPPWISEQSNKSFFPSYFHCSRSIPGDQFNGLCSEMTHQNGIKLCKNSGYCQNGTSTAFVFCSRLIRLCNVPLLGLISAPGSTQMILILCGIF